jgi:hypothetical protein
MVVVEEEVHGSVSINGALVYVGGYANYSYNGATYNSGTGPIANTGSGGGGGGAFGGAYGTNGSDGIVIIQF